MGADLDPRFRPAKHLRPKIKALCTQLVPAIRSAGIGCGYCIVVHGSQERDLDIVAIPWVDDASDPIDLVKTIVAVLNKAGILSPWYYPNPDSWTKKPHGRLAFNMISNSDNLITCKAGAFPFIDLSIIPKKGQPC